MLVLLLMRGVNTLKQVRLTVGVVTLRREEKATDFVCQRENKPKKAKNIGTWVDNNGVTLTICNGCYGELLSKDKFLPFPITTHHASKEGVASTIESLILDGTLAEATVTED
jgi:hypothetical protein